ncbi:MAG: GNAT family N-acetyltransferase [Bacteroidota bacterium]
MEPSLEKTTLLPEAFQTARLQLRRLAPEDAPDMYRYASKEEVAHFLTWDAHVSIEDSLVTINRLNAGWDTGQAYVFGVIPNGRKGLVGTIGLHFERPWSAEVGYAVDVPYWGNGYMTEALIGVLDFARTYFPALYRIEAHHDLLNPASGRVMEKAGMTYEGIRKAYSHERGPDGRPRDLIMHAIVIR